MALPLKTTIEDFDALGKYLKTQVGWVPISKIKSTITPKHADNRKIESGKYIGFLDRDGANVRLTDSGLSYSSSSVDEEKASAMLKMLLSADLYSDTIRWMHFSGHHEPTKTLVGNYWHDHHSAKLDGAQGAALTDAVVFFFRVAGAAGLGKFIGAGGGRPETYLKGDSDAIERAATLGKAKAAADGVGVDPRAPESEVEVTGPATEPVPVLKNSPQSMVSQPQPRGVSIATSPAVHINIEIHIAADATASTVEEIFKNMRKYVLDSPAADDE